VTKMAGPCYRSKPNNVRRSKPNIELCYRCEPIISLSCTSNLKFYYAADANQLLDQFKLLKMIAASSYSFYCINNKGKGFDSALRLSMSVLPITTEPQGAASF
jgi:hypothetical protein